MGGDCNSEGNALTNNTGVFAMLDYKALASVTDDKCSGQSIFAA
jgi:hypothetical protein